MKQIYKNAAPLVRRLRWAAILFTFIVSVALGIMLSLPAFTQKAYAAGEEYAFNYSTKDEDDINKDLKDTNPDPVDDDYYHSLERKTVAYAKGGAFSDGQPPRLTANEDYNNADERREQMYNGTFNCQGYSIGFSVILDLPNPIGNGNAKGMVVYNSISGNGENLSAGPLNSSGRAAYITEQNMINALPGACRVANYAQNNGITATNIPPNYREGGINSWKNDSTGSSNGTSGNTTGGAGGIGDAADDERSLSCDAQFSNPLTWILCPVMDLMTETIQGVDGMIMQRLDVDDDSIFGGGESSQGYYQAWKSFRDIALGLMVAAGLLVLISQALGMEILDAYTIRKVLPRILIAAIGIIISWPLLQFIIGLTNDMGYGIRYIIYYPFSDAGGEVALSFGDSFVSQLGNFFFGATGLVVAIGATVFYIGIIFSLLATAALAVFVAIVVLVLREVVVILLAIMAPIAIVAYILPNTQKAYRLWWESFSKALLMFPLIAGLIAIGHVFSGITLAANKSLLGQTIGFLAYFAPYFLIPMTVKFAGGALAQIGGLVNDRSRGGFDRLRKGRAERLQKKHEMVAHKFKTGDFHNPIPSRFRNTSRAAGALVGAANTLGTHSTAGLIRGGLGFGTRGRTAREAKLMEGIKGASEEQAMKDNSDINAFNRLMVLTAKHGGNQVRAEEDLRQWYSDDRNEYNRKFEGKDLEDKIADARARMANVGGFNAGRAGAAYMAMAQDGTAIRDVEDMGNIAAWVSEGSGNVAYRLISNAASASAQRGRSELAPAQVHKERLAAAAVAAHGDSTVPAYRAAIDGATMSGAGGKTGYEVMSAAPSRVIRGNVEHAMNMIDRYMKDPNSIDYEDAVQAASVIKDLQNTALTGQGTTDNKKALLDSMAVDGRQQLLDNFTSLRDPRSVPRGMDDMGNQLPLQHTPGYVPDDKNNRVKAGPTVDEHVTQIVGARYASQNTDDIEAGLRRQAEAQQQQQQGGQPGGPPTS